MVFSVLWTLLPDGFDDDGRARLALVASPRPVGPTLGASEVLNWPALVAGLGTTVDIISPGHAAAIQATVTGPAPDQALWASLFPADTPVAPPTPIAAELTKAETPAASSAHVLIRALYDQARDAGPLDRDHQVMKTVAGLNAWRNATGAVKEADAMLDPRHLTRGRIRDAGTLLRAKGQPAAADVVALIPLLRRLGRHASTTDKGPIPPNRKPGPAGAIPVAEQADFHQVVSAVLRHPALAQLLGFRINLTMPAFTSSRLIRAQFRGSFPAGHKPLAQPWSAVVSDPARHRFVMATQPDARAEVINGMLDLRTPDRHAVSDLDAMAVVQQLDVLALKLARPSETGPFVLPARRQAGLTMVQADRRAARYAHMVERNARFESAEFPDEVEGAPVLYADDVTIGYRVDVAADGGPYRSLMRRLTSFTAGKLAGKREFTVPEEGHLDAVSPVQQYDNDDEPHLFVGEELFGWHGWALSAPFPTPAVGAQTNTDPHVVAVNPEPVPGFPLKISTAVEPGTLQRLRFGLSYSFRVRAVDLAGNSIDPAGIDPTLATAPVRYKRVETLHPPVVVPRRRYGPGESLTHLVVTSEGDGVPLTDPAERHLAPPKTSQRLAELHGAFDVAFGKDVPQAVRDRMFDLARREEGSFLDPAPGVAVLSSDPAATDVTHLPIPRGEPLKPGEYVVVDNPRPALPYLPDVASDGVALAGLPDVKAPLVVRWTDGTVAWPDRAAPMRLVVRAAAANAVATTVDNGRKVVTISLAPAARATLRVSSVPTADALGVLETPVAAGPLDQARKGQRPELTPSQELTLLHAVRTPLTDPVLTGLSILKNPSDPGTTLKFSATVAADAASTGKVALEATWTDVVDRGYGPVTYEPRQVTIATSAFEPADTARVLTAKHDFGDKKHRVVTFRGVSSTRFGEYFPPVDEGDRSHLREGPGQEVSLLAWQRPTRPLIHSVVPMYRVNVDTTANMVKIDHVFDGFRVFLRRPFMTSGDGEMLGVVAARDATAATAIAGNPKLRDLVTRWGTDPLMADGAFIGQQKYITPEDFLKPGGGMVPWSAAELPEVAVPGFADAASVRVMGYPVTFDAERNLWRSDVRFPMSGTGNESFARLAVVGYRPGEVFEAYPDFRATAITTSELIPARATRTVRAFVDGAGPRVSILVTTPAGGTTSPHKLRVRWQRRAFDPNIVPNPAPDACVDAKDVGAVTASFTPGIPGFAVTIKPPSSVTGTALDSLLKGRIVIEEVSEGWDLATVNAVTKRPVFTAVVELQDLL